MLTSSILRCGAASGLRRSAMPHCVIDASSESSRPAPTVPAPPAARGPRCVASTPCSRLSRPRLPCAAFLRSRPDSARLHTSLPRSPSFS
eukprot:4579146-Prymnesium_polylepis.1